MLFITAVQLFLLFTLQSEGILDLPVRQRTSPVPFSLISSHTFKLANKAEDRQDYETALKLYRQLAAHYEKNSGLKNSETVYLMNRLYKLCMFTENYREALPIAWKIYKLMERMLGKEHEDTLEALTELGDIYSKLEKYEKAEQILKRAYALTKAQLGQNHKDTIHILYQLAHVYRLSEQNPQQNLDLALRYYRKVWDVWSKDPEMGEEHELTLNALEKIGTVLGMQLKLEESAQIFQKLFDLRKASLGEDHPWTQRVRKILMYTLTKDGKTGRANEILRKEGPTPDPDGAKDDESLFALVETKASALAEKGKYGQALEILGKFYEREILKREVSTDIFTILDKLLSYSLAHGELEQTVEWAKVGIDLTQGQGQGPGQTEKVKVNIKIRTDQDDEQRLSVRLKAIESLILVHAQQNHEEEIDKWFQTAQKIIKGKEESTNLFQKFLVIEAHVAEFKDKIGRTDQATRLYFKMAESQQLVGGATFLLAIIQLVEIARAKDDYKLLTSVAQKFMQHSQQPEPEPEALESNDNDKDKDNDNDNDKVDMVTHHFDLIRGVASHLSAKAKEEFDLENYEAAFSLFKTVESIWPKKTKGHFLFISQLLEGITTIAFKLNKFDEGFVYLEKAINVYKDKLASEPEMEEKPREVIVKQMRLLQEVQAINQKFAKARNFMDTSQLPFAKYDDDDDPESESTNLDKREKSEL